MTQHAKGRLGLVPYALITAGSIALFITLHVVSGEPHGVDASAYASYLVIPPLVVGVALATGRRSLGGMVLDSLEISVIKFGATFVYAAFVFFIAPAPLRSPPTKPLAVGAILPAAASSPGPIAPPAPQAGARQAVHGRIQGSKGRPYVVYLRSEALTSAPEPPPLRLANDGTGLTPALAIVPVGAALEVQSLDGQLHTLQGRAVAASPFTWPLLPGGAVSQHRLNEAGTYDLVCTIGGAAHGEQPARLVVAPTPFVATVDAAGAFSWADVPVGAATVGWVGTQGVPAEKVVEVRPEAPLELDLEATQP